MRSHRRLAGTAAAGLLVILDAACASGPETPIPLVGAAADLAVLAGQWEGSYTSSATGRSGTISFTLAALRDSAYGDVVMIPRGFGRPLQARERPSAPARTEPLRAAALTIRFVRVAAGHVSGARAPYADPETGAKLVTAFEGRVRGDTITGTYTTHVAGAVESQMGQWEVMRRRG